MKTLIYKNLIPIKSDQKSNQQLKEEKLNNGKQLFQYSIIFILKPVAKQRIVESLHP